MEWWEKNNHDARFANRKYFTASQTSPYRTDSELNTAVFGGDVSRQRGGDANDTHNREVLYEGTQAMVLTFCDLLDACKTRECPEEEAHKQRNLEQEQKERVRAEKAAQNQNKKLEREAKRAARTAAHACERARNRRVNGYTRPNGGHRYSSVCARSPPARMEIQLPVP